MQRIYHQPLLLFLDIVQMRFCITLDSLLWKVPMEVSAKMNNNRKQ